MYILVSGKHYYHSWRMNVIKISLPGKRVSIIPEGNNHILCQGISRIPPVSGVPLEDYNFLTVCACRGQFLKTLASWPDPGQSVQMSRNLRLLSQTACKCLLAKTFLADVGSWVVCRTRNVYVRPINSANNSSHVGPPKEFNSYFFELVLCWPYNKTTLMALRASHTSNNTQRSDYLLRSNRSPTPQNDSRFPSNHNVAITFFWLGRMNVWSGNISCWSK